MLFGMWSRKMNHSASPRKKSRRRSRPGARYGGGAAAASILAHWYHEPSSPAKLALAGKVPAVLACDLQVPSLPQDLERNGMRWNRMRFHLTPFARTGDRG